MSSLPKPLSGLVGSLVVSALLWCAADLGSAERATIMTPEQVIAALSGKDYRAQDLAEGQLYLLPESAFPVLSAVLDRSRDQHSEPWAKRITRALVLRGYLPAVKAYVNNFFPSDEHSTISYSLSEEQVLGQSTVEELRPIVREFVARVTSSKIKYTYSGNDLWVRMAGMTGEPAALHAAMDLTMGPRPLLALSSLTGRFDPDRCSDFLLAAMNTGEAPARLAYLRLLRSGWRSGPSKAVANLMKDPDAQVRSAFAQTLDRSASEAALDLILQGLSDQEASVRSMCLAALGNYQGPPQIPLLRKLATDDRVEPSMRQQAWWILSNVPGDLLVTEAKALVSNSTADRNLRSTAVNYLMRRDGSRWLLDAVPKLDPAMKAAVLSTLAQSGSVAVLDEIPAFLRRAEPALVGQVLSALAVLKDDKVLPLLINHLKDSRVEVRRAAAMALNNATGLSYQPALSLRSDANEADVAAEIKVLHGAWSRWYELFAAPPAPGLAEDLVTMRAVLMKREGKEDVPLLGLTGDPFTVLLRLSGDKSVGTKALTMLSRLGDARTAALLISLIDGPTFSQRRDELTRVLMQCRVDTTIAPQVFKLLGRPDTEDLAIRVLIAWRVASPTLTEAIFRRGSLSSELMADLASWKDCPVIGAARKLMTDDKADERQRSQALALLVQLGDERDVKALGQEVAESGPAAYLATRGLVRMATGGVDFAARELARILSLTPRKAGGKPARPLQGKPVEEPPQKPDPAPGIIAALKERPRGERGASVPLPEALLVAVRTWTKTTKVAEQQLAGLTLLIEANDVSGVEVLRDVLADAEPALAKRAFEEVTSARSLEARPFVDLLVNLPGLDDQAVSRLVNWYREVAKLPPAELAKLKTTLLTKQEAQFGKPVRDLVITIDFGGTTAPLGAKGLKAKVQIKNIGKKPYSFIPDWLDFNLLVKRLGDEAGEFNRTLHLDFKSKISPTSGAIATVLPPGQTLSSTLTYEAPNDYFTSSAHRIRVRCGVPRSLGTPEDDERAIFTTQWIDFTFIPPLWEAIDRRSTAAR